MQTTEVRYSGAELASLYGSMMITKQMLERKGDAGELAKKVTTFIDMMDRASLEGEFSDALLNAANKTYQQIIELSPSDRLRLANEDFRKGSFPKYPAPIEFEKFMNGFDRMTAVGSLVVYFSQKGPTVGIISSVASGVDGVVAQVMLEKDGQRHYHPIDKTPYGQPTLVMLPVRHTIDGP